MATSVVLPSTINAAALAAAAPTFPTTINSVSSVSATAASAVADVKSYVADQLNGGFTGLWTFYTGVDVANVNTMTLNSTNNYSQTSVSKLMSNNTWGANPKPGEVYQLPISGNWILSPNSDFFNGLYPAGKGITSVVDNLDGTLTYTPSGFHSETVSVTRTNLAGTTFAGLPTYPAGAASYMISRTSAHDEYYLQLSIPQGNIKVAFPVTDKNGVAMYDLPPFTGAFCDPTEKRLYVPVSPSAPDIGHNYFYVLDMTGLSNMNGGIAAPCDGTSPVQHGVYSVPNGQNPSNAGAALNNLGTTLLEKRSTGNPTVPMVIYMANYPGAPISLSNPPNIIFGAYAGKVYKGFMIRAGTPLVTYEENNITINVGLSGGMALAP